MKSINTKIVHKIDCKNILLQEINAFFDYESSLIYIETNRLSELIKGIIEGDVDTYLYDENDDLLKEVKELNEFCKKNSIEYIWLN